MQSGFQEKYIFLRTTVNFRFRTAITFLLTESEIVKGASHILYIDIKKNKFIKFLFENI